MLVCSLKSKFYWASNMSAGSGLWVHANDGRKFISTETKAILRSINANMSQVDKVFIFNWTKRSFIVFHNTRRTVIWFGCRLRRRHRHITYSSPSPERGLTTVFYALDNDYCYLYTNDRSSGKSLLLILLEKNIVDFLNSWSRRLITQQRCHGGA
jgi:hypothetical protein